MKNVTAHIKSNGDSTSIIFNTRITSAIEMLEYEEKLHVEQETSGPWDSFKEDMYALMEPLNRTFDISVEYFKGYQDVIFELTLTIASTSESKYRVDSEHVAGTLAAGICKHFGWVDFYKPTLTKSYDSYRFENLLAFDCKN